MFTEHGLITKVDIDRKIGIIKHGANQSSFSFVVVDDGIPAVGDDVEYQVENKYVCVFLHTSTSILYTKFSKDTP